MNVSPTFTGFRLLLLNKLNVSFLLKIRGAIFLIKNLSIVPDIADVLVGLGETEGVLGVDGETYPPPTVTTPQLEPGEKEELGHPVIFDSPPVFVIVPYVEFIIETKPPLPPCPQDKLFPPTFVIIADIGVPIELVIVTFPALPPFVFEFTPFA